MSLFVVPTNQHDRVATAAAAVSFRRQFLSFPRNPFLFFYLSLSSSAELNCCKERLRFMSSRAHWSHFTKLAKRNIRLLSVDPCSCKLESNVLQNWKWDPRDVARPVILKPTLSLKVGERFVQRLVGDLCYPIFWGKCRPIATKMAAKWTKYVGVLDHPSNFCFRCPIF